MNPIGIEIRLSSMDDLYYSNIHIETDEVAMLNSLKIPLSIMLALAAIGVAHSRDRSSRSTEFYHIFDFKTQATKSAMIKAATAGFAINVSESDTITPIIMDEPPETARRFTIVNPLENSRMAGMMAMIPASQLAQFKQASCDGAVWIANANRKIQGSLRFQCT